MKKVLTGIYSILLAFQISSVCCEAARYNSKIEGTVYHAIKRDPVPNIEVIAVTQTNIKEDKIYEKSVAKTDSKGLFTLKGLSPRYEYKVTTNLNGYVSDEWFLNPPMEDKTVEIKQGIRICPLPPQEGIFVWDQAGQTNWRKLENNAKFKVMDISKFGVGTIDINYPAQLGSSERVFTITATKQTLIKGEAGQLSKIEEAFSLNSPHSFTVAGEKFQKYSIMMLYFYPKVKIVYESNTPRKRKELNLEEGYHLGVEEFGHWFNLVRKTKTWRMVEVCNDGIKNFRFSKPLNPDPKAYYAIIPTEWELNADPKDAKRWIENGMDGIVFKVKTN